MYFLDIREVSAGCRMEFKCWLLDVVVVQCILCKASPVDVPCRLGRALGPTWKLCQVTSTNSSFEDKINIVGSRDHAVVRALASYQCGSGLIPCVGVTCGLRWCWLLSLCHKDFLKVLWFSLLLKNLHSQIPI